MKLWTANLDLENRTMNVVKRDGRSVRFDEDKIFQALKKKHQIKLAHGARLNRNG
ncbi:ATP cone domain-containing protein [Lactococcus fujiensis]|uniref:ATP cone domain-containing protein n=1 Tax=Lactococcus fujiensis TaxID=610251 RepID=UPI000A944887